ncbi:MaoC/PaaZ C-terminal domain-containing protein [Rhizosphaericola mali]|uniref:MaoC family dehydratase n=1 Tax=Rhizosphaericola mali TaxID=2545455 RepID=A0A5P2G4L8_9BACT|nr:MaoC/PaaZ C-terminal domain-containing protein [Rhizosphaericola mali]QES88710.1 MaoC family dehydratase [Rhizosphaericola mali]
MEISMYKKVGDNRYRETYGLYYEDFVVGDIFEHRPGRTITETDNIWQCLLTMNSQQLHFDSVYAAHTEWKKPLVDSTITLSILTGMSVHSVSGKVVANLGWNNVKCLAPVFAGDTLYAESEIISKRESKSRITQGIVTVKTIGKNQNAEIVMEFERTMLIYKKGNSPEQTAGY